MLPIVLARAKEGGQIKGVIPHLLEDSLSFLLYVDDTVMFFLKHAEEPRIFLREGARILSSYKNNAFY